MPRGILLLSLLLLLLLLLLFLLLLLLEFSFLSYIQIKVNRLFSQLKLSPGEIKQRFFLGHFPFPESEAVFYGKAVLKNFSKFTGKHLCCSLKPQACNFIKKEIRTQVFSCEFSKMFQNTVLQNTFMQLYLPIHRTFKKILQKFSRELYSGLASGGRIRILLFSRNER